MYFESMQRVVFCVFCTASNARQERLLRFLTAAHHQHSCKDYHEVQFNSLLCSSQVVWLFSH